MSDIYNTFPYYGYGTEDGSAYYKKPQPMDGEAVENAIDEKISDLVGNAPTDLDTIEELAAAVQSGSGDASEIYAKIDEVESKIPTTVEQLSDSANYAKVSDIPTSLEGLDNSETKYQSEDEVSATVQEAVENLFASAEYDDSTKKIIFKNSDGTQVGEVDATDFIKDGMVSGATIENGKLIITFNEESGSENVELDLTDIFNPNNYYTATECDNKYQPKGDYTTLAEVEAEGYTKFDGDYESLTNKPVIPTIPENVSEFNNDANYTTLEEVAAEGYSKFDGDYESLENKPVIPTVPENVSEFNNDADYTTLQAVANEGYTKFDGDYESLTNKPVIPVVPENVSEFNNDANYTTLEEVANEGYSKFDGDYENLTNKPVIPAVPSSVSAFENDANYTTLEEVAAEGYSKFDGNYENLTNKPVIPVVPENVSEFTNDAGYLTALTGDERYYDKTTTDSIFISKSEYEDDMNLKADKSELNGYTTDTELSDAVHELVVRINKLEAQNAVLVEKGTDSAEDIANMSAEDAANADVVVATDEAIAALATPKTFKSVSVAGGEVGDTTVINLIATDNIDVNGLTVSGQKGTGNGKIIFGANDVTISNVNIEEGCTVYNVFEGKQDKDTQNCIDTFNATNITVNDTDLAHNVFNIYQLNDNAAITISDSYFNLNVANSNVLRLSNITNAKNVNVIFRNVNLTYENKPYSDGDVKWAGLVIYQPFGTDAAYSGDYTNTQTWTFNFINCRYNGEIVTQNNVGQISQLLYQYDVNHSGVTEEPNIFGTINISAE